jgi:hypothetical protein
MSVLVVGGIGEIVVSSFSTGGFVILAVVLCIPFALYPPLRLSLVFPAKAVGARVSLSESWRYTRGEGWRLVGVTLVAMAPLFALTMIQSIYRRLDSVDTSGLQGEIPFVNVWIVDRVIWAVPSYLTLALIVTVLSLAFRHRTEWEAPKAERPRPLSGA